MKPLPPGEGNDRPTASSPSRWPQRPWNGVLYSALAGVLLVLMSVISGSTQEAVLAVTAAGTAAAARRPSRRGVASADTSLIESASG